MQFQNILLTFLWNQRVVVHRRSFFKVVPKFYDQYRLKDIRKFPKLNPRLSETVDSVENTQVESKCSEEKLW